jgi:positive regulator of sigma E activity
MTERGIVTEIKDRLVTVQLEMTEGCGACINEACKTGRREIKGYNREALELAEGDEVLLEISGKAQMTGALWVLGLPLLLFGGGYGLGRLLFPGPAEGPAALTGLAGLVLGMGIGVLVQKRQRMESLPLLIRKLEPEVGGEVPEDYDENAQEYLKSAP